MIKRILAIVVLAVAIQFIGAQTSSAAPVVGFNPGMIVDDATFTNKNSMSPSEIQTFLNSKLASCDTYGQQNSEFGGPDLNGDGRVQRWEYAKNKYGQDTFPCLKDYTEGGKSSAQIIYDAGQEFSINPQILIVLLQKEQSLVTDSWPLSVQYRTATGYACPDNGTCATEYHGLTNQLRWSARMFRAIMNDSPTWYTPYELGNNKVFFNPGPYDNANDRYYGRFGNRADIEYCGNTIVNIQNRATQALYNYTPYQPNQSSLNAGWGNGDLCGAYGNRNFYLYMNEWFGGWLLSTVDDSKLYIRGANGTYYQIMEYAQLQALGIAYLKTYTTTSSYLSSLTSAGPLTSAVMFNSIGDVYAIDSGKLKYHSAATYNAYGRPALSNLAAGLDGGVIPRASQDMTTVLAVHNVGNLYAASDGEKHYLSSFAYNTLGYAATPTNWMSQYFVDHIPNGYPLLQAGSIVKTSDTGAYFVVNSNRTSKRPLETRLGASLKFGVYTDTSTVLNKLATNSAAAVNLFVKDALGKLYILDGAGTSKILLSPSVLASINKTDSNFTLADNTFLDKFPTKVANSSAILVDINGDGRIYKVESNGELVWIQTGEDFTKLGYTYSQVVTISSDTVGQVFVNNGRSLLLPGTFYDSGDGIVMYLDGNSIGHRVPTADLFADDFNRSWSSVRKVSTVTKNFYTTGAVLSNLAKDSTGGEWIISHNKKHKVATNLIPHYDPGSIALTIDQSILDSIPTSIAATRFIRINNDARVYYVENGTKFPLGSVTAFSSRGGTDWNMVVSISPSAASTLATGQILN